MKIFELFNEWTTPTGEIQGKLLSGMMDTGGFSHVKWEQVDTTGPSPIPGIKSTDVIIASSAWSAQDKIFDIIRFIQKNAHYKHPIQSTGQINVQKVSVFHWEGIQFVVVRMRKAGETVYNIYAAPDNTPHQPKDEEIEEQNPKANAYALTGSGRWGKEDSPAHKKVRTPGTTYSKTSKKQDWPATKHGARDGFIG